MKPQKRPILTNVSNSLVLLALVALGRAGAATVWTGPMIDFSKAALADPNQSTNQDRITPNVWITRGTTQGLYNAKTETGFIHFASPADTEWANGTTADLASLSYKDWDTWAKIVNGGPPLTVGKHAVLHLKSEDIYLDIIFTGWGGSSGAFAYSRSTPSLGNQPPSVRIIEPADGVALVPTGPINLQAEAGDPDGSVTNVQFFDGPTSLGNVSSSPYSLPAALVAGPHTITAVATDNLGVATTSAEVHLTILASSQPVVTITSPADGTVAIGPLGLTIHAVASDTGGVITNVQFFDGAVSLGAIGSAPYDLPVSLGIGTHSLTAVATDDHGTTATASPVSVTLIPNSPPSIAITNPISGLTLIGPANVLLQAVASDPDGSVTNVEFFDGAVSLGSSSALPYQLLAPLTIGSHTLTAIATDNLGTTTTASPVLVTVVANSPPSIAITNPISGLTLIGPANVLLQAVAGDTDGSVTNVEFFDGAVSLGSSSSIPYQLLAPLAIGSHTLTAIATDNLGTTTTASPVLVTVVANSPPSIAITNPISGLTLIGSANVLLQAVATDPDGSVTNVEFFDGAASLGSSSALPYQLLASLRIGSHTLTAIATDSLGTTTTASPVSVTVVPNSRPSVAITSPTNGATFTAPATVNLRATASDTDGRVIQVEFFMDADSLGAVSSAEGSVLLTNLSAGTYTLRAVATDDLDATATNNVTITVQNPQLTPPILFGATFEQGVFHLTLPTQKGFVYTVQYALEPDSRGWQPLTNFPGTGADIQITDPAPAESSKFYRVESH